MTHLTQQPSRRGWLPWEFSIFLSRFFFFLSLFLSFSSRESRTPSSTINCFALYISKTVENKRERRLGEEIEDAASLSLRSPCLQEASASFAEWERLMKGLGSGVIATDNPFTQVMGLVTQMYKQTAIAKVMGDQVVWSISCFTSTYVIISRLSVDKHIVGFALFMDFHGHRPYHLNILAVIPRC